MTYSPCVNCLSAPCACPRVNVSEGRYSFDPSLSYNPYQPHMHCVDCYTHPCVCRDNDSSHNGPTIFCALCHCNPCLCRPADAVFTLNCGCILGNCDCTVECDYQCVDKDCIGCKLPQLSEDEPRELHDVEDPWMHRSAGMKCSTCMWFVEKVGDGTEVRSPGEMRIGRCRRHAPTMNGYPVVYDMDWCGDHKLDETKT